MKLSTKKKVKEPTYTPSLKADFIRNRYVYFMAIPMLVYYLVFYYAPMYGALIGFQNFSPARGMLASKWVGFTHFSNFFSSIYFWRLLRNTFLISFYNLLIGFPAPIILALLLNEVNHKRFKSTIQTLTYLPHFVSMVVICGMIKVFVGYEGIINDLIVLMGGERSMMLDNPALFRPIYIISDIWQQVGWDTIIYLSALTGINAELYEAARIDGAGRFKQLWHITLPGILPTIVLMLIMRMGTLLSVGYEKIILLYTPLTYETAEVISSYVYKVGLQQFNWSYSTAIGLFNSIVNYTFLVISNKISRAATETSLW